MRLWITFTILFITAQSQASWAAALVGCRVILTNVWTLVPIRNITFIDSCNQQLHWSHFTFSSVDSLTTVYFILSSVAIPLLITHQVIINAVIVRVTHKLRTRTSWLIIYVSKHYYWICYFVLYGIVFTTSLFIRMIWAIKVPITHKCCIDTGVTDLAMELTIKTRERTWTHSNVITYWVKQQLPTVCFITLITTIRHTITVGSHRNAV